jgi:inosine/xanthosine triphosphatase
LKRIVVASTNPVKIEAARAGFERMFPGEVFQVEGVSVASGVSHQPMTDSETYQGALNRAQHARLARPEVDYWVGIEGGCEDKYGELFAYAWMVVLSREGLSGKGRSGAFCLPREISALIREGVELGEADDRVFGRSNSKQMNGAVGLLTADAINRQVYYEHALVLALIPFKNPALHFTRLTD